MSQAPPSTGRLLHGICRTGLLAVLLTAPAALWWPSIPGWAGLTAALLAVWGCWLCWRVVVGQRDIPAHPIHLALGVVIALATAHLLGTGLPKPPVDDGQIGGEFLASLMVHWGLLGLLVVLCQDLLPRSALASAGETAFALATLAGSLAALATARLTEGRLMLAMMGWAGLAVFARPLAADAPARGKAARLARIVRPAGLLAGAATLAALCPPSLAVTAGALSVTLLIAAALLPGRRAPWLIAALVAAASAVIQAAALGWRLPPWPAGPVGLLGRGEQALVHYGRGVGGFRLLVEAFGWLGAGAFALGLLGSLVWAMWPARAQPRTLHGRALLTALAAVLALAAWLAPGGMFNPAANVVLGVVWAVLPLAFGRQASRRSGWWLLAYTAAICLTIGLVRHRGLLMWMLFSFGRGQLMAHTLVAAYVTLLLLWLMDGRRGRPWAALALGMAAGPGGELAQNLLAHKAQWEDVAAHLVGVTGALVAYLLCRAARWAEGNRAPEERPVERITTENTEDTGRKTLR